MKDGLTNFISKACLVIECIEGTLSPDSRHLFRVLTSHQVFRQSTYPHYSGING
jgi:hypothetical protein